MYRIRHGSQRCCATTRIVAALPRAVRIDGQHVPLFDDEPGRRRRRSAGRVRAKLRIRGRRACSARKSNHSAGKLIQLDGEVGFAAGNVLSRILYRLVADRARDLRRGRGWRDAPVVKTPRPPDRRRYRDLVSARWWDEFHCIDMARPTASPRDEIAGFCYSERVFVGPSLSRGGLSIFACATAAREQDTGVAVCT